MPRLNLKMPFGEVSIDFTDNADLIQQIEKVDFNALAKAVSEKVPFIELTERKVRDEMKDLFDTDGKYLIFKNDIPKAKIDMVMLSIYGYGTSATIDEIRHTTGIPDPSGDVINAGGSKKYFTNLERLVYGLSPDGLQKVTDEVIPSLREKRVEDKGKGKG